MTHKLDISESLAQNYDRIDSRTFADIEEYIIKPSEPDYSTLANETFGFKSKQAVTIVKNCVEASPVDFIKLKLIKMLSADRKNKPALNKDHLFNACNNSSNLTSETNFVVTRNITHKSLDVLKGYCPDVLLPYLREFVTSMTSRGTVPQLMLKPESFSARIMMQMQETSEKGAEGTLDA